MGTNILQLEANHLFGGGSDGVLSLSFPNSDLQSVNTAGGSANSIAPFVSGTCASGNSDKDSEVLDYYLFTCQLNIASTPGWNQHSPGKNYGIYLEYLKCDVQAIGQSISLEQSSPQAQVGATTYSDQAGFSLSHSIGAMGDMPTTNTTFGVHASHGETRTIPDITIENNNNNINPSWRFDCNNLPKKHGTEGSTLKMSGPPNVTHGDLQLYLAWVWTGRPSDRVAQAKGLTASFSVTAGYAWRHIKHDKMEKDVHGESNPITFEATLPFIPIPDDNQN